MWHHRPRTGSLLLVRPLGKAHLASSKEAPVATRGVVYVHSAPPALCPHVEWAIGGVLGVRVTLDWTPQPAAPGHRARPSCPGRPTPAPAPRSPQRCATGCTCASRSPRSPAPAPRGALVVPPPRLGLFHATTGVHGDIMIREDRLRAAAGPRRERPGDQHRRPRWRRLLGKAWDDELESVPLRRRGRPRPLAPPGRLTPPLPTPDTITVPWSCRVDRGLQATSAELTTVP